MPSKNDRNVVRYRRLSSIYDWGLQRNPLFERPRARLFELADIKSGERVLAVGGASLTRSLTEAIGTTPLRMSHHEHSPAVDIIRLTPR